MTDLAAPSRSDQTALSPRRDPTAVALRSSSGQELVRLDPVPAVATLTAALVVAPRLTALAAVGALLLRMSITLEGGR